MLLRANRVAWTHGPHFGINGYLHLHEVEMNWEKPSMETVVFRRTETPKLTFLDLEPGENRLLSTLAVGFPDHVGYQVFQEAVVSFRKSVGLHTEEILAGKLIEIAQPPVVIAFDVDYGSDAEHTFGSTIPFCPVAEYEALLARLSSMLSVYRQYEKSMVILPLQRGWPNL